MMLRFSRYVAVLAIADDVLAITGFMPVAHPVAFLSNPVNPVESLGLSSVLCRVLPSCHIVGECVFLLWSLYFDPC